MHCSRRWRDRSTCGTNVRTKYKTVFHENCHNSL